MGLLGKLIKTTFDVATTPIAIIKDVIPGAGGYVDGNRSHTSRKKDQIEDDAEEIRNALDDI